MSSQAHAALPQHLRHLLREAWCAERDAAQSSRASGDGAGEWRHLDTGEAGISLVAVLPIPDDLRSLLGATV
jgi:hypothetical protein